MEFLWSKMTIFCAPRITCPEGMEPAVKCVRDVLYKDDVELEWLPCETGYSDGYGTGSSKKCKICSKYEELCEPETNSVCQINSTEGTMEKLIIQKHLKTKKSKTIELMEILFALIICFTVLHALLVIFVILLRKLKCNC